MQSRSILTLALIWAVPFATSPLLSQEGDVAPGPAKEVSAFDKLLGTWEGTGTVNLGPGVPKTKWTATSHNKKVLGGHFVREDVNIVFQGDSAPPPLVFRTFYGFDSESKKWKAFAISNMGTAEEKQVHWVDGKMMTGGSKTEIHTMSGEPEFVVERWSTTFGEDSYTMVGYQAIGNGKPTEHVSGEFKKVKATDASFSVHKVKPMVPVAKQMSVLHKLRGNYRLKGWMIVMPGMPKTEIGATEAVENIFGGTAIELRLKGDPIPNMGAYEGYGAMVWSPLDGCYKSLWIDNVGYAGLVDAHLRGKNIISGVAAVAMGEPVVNRSVITLNDDGSLAKVTEHAIHGASDPTQTFHAEYAKK